MRYVFLLMFVLLAVPVQAGGSERQESSWEMQDRMLNELSDSMARQPQMQFLFTPDGRLGTVTPFGGGRDPIQAFVLPDGTSGFGIPMGDGMYSIMPGPTFRDHLGISGPPKNVPRGKRLMEFLEPW